LVVKKKNVQVIRKRGKRAYGNCLGVKGSDV